MKRDLLNSFFTALLVIGVIGSTARHFIDMGNGVAETVLFVTLVVAVPGFAIFPRKDSEGKRKRDNVFIVLTLLTSAVAIYEKNTRVMSIKEAQETVDKWIREYGVRYFSELTNMACLTEEVGELARIMARRYGDQSFKSGENDDPSEEMADILWVLLCLANQTGTDLTEAFRKSIEKKTARDHDRHRNNPKLKA